MKTSVIKQILLFAFGFAVLFSCKKADDTSLPKPQVKMGVAKLSGKYINPNAKEGKKTILTLNLSNPVTGESLTKESIVDAEGNYSFEVNTETDQSFAYLQIDGIYVVPLSTEKETKLDIEFDGSKHHVKSVNSTVLDARDIEIGGSLVRNVIMTEINSRISPSKSISEMSYDEYVRFIVDSAMIVPHNILKADTTASDRFKELSWGELELFYMENFLFDYDRRTDSVPDKSFYKFMKEFDFNSPKYLEKSFYPIILDIILSNKTLNIPRIGDMPAAEWLKDVKANLSELVGFNDGLFYDLLLTNTYAKQLTGEIKPFSDKQKQNISVYFKGSEMEKILLRKNEETIALAAKFHETVVNETPNVAKEELIDAIVAKYKGKVVVFDLWATWCGPCLSAMTEFKKAKAELFDQDVVFIYLTNTSSPRKTWEEKIKSIGSDHYYFEDWDQWGYIMDYFGFEAIPSYVIYDKDGKLVDKFTGYPGTIALKEKIEALLN